MMQICSQKMEILLNLLFIGLGDWEEWVQLNGMGQQNLKLTTWTLKEEAILSMEDVPTINWDHTGLKHVPVSSQTMQARGWKRVSKVNKRQIVFLHFEWEVSSTAGDLCLKDSYKS